MSDYYQSLSSRVQQRLQGRIGRCGVALGELTVEVPKAHLLEVCRVLRDEPEFACEQLIDLCGLDYSAYGNGGWSGPRYAVAYHLLSVHRNHRIRLKVFTDGEVPLVDSVVSIWSSANWYEREAFDLFGIVFEGHPDLRRILTDYGFVGHPFRKDFPVSGNVEMRYDPDKGRVVYQPVSIEPRDMIPRVIRHDHRYVTPEVPVAQGGK
ncbi:MAG: NADH-quinone oxidoreductase subunit C [Gammaproteobacteria bacterium HGW-Gammaproteobacteria-1]|jgi:NADH-quinone oxidoreductase subunit C|nr:MAG: NADH-quinone oxidoreductase subunit C [Gammaproteobacteria bacterium HGW-Gammaproteobacteria-1]